MKKFLIVLLIIVSSLGLFWGVVNIIPTYKVVEENVWRKDDNVLISAHRGGAELNPENTKMAFDYVIKETSYTDIVELDLRLTKDNVIVINHDVNKGAGASRNDGLDYIFSNNLETEYIAFVDADDLISALGNANNNITVKNRNKIQKQMKLFSEEFNNFYNSKQNYHNLYYH